ncbi:MAG: type VI secretion system baseplate subunit TssF [Rhodothermales bacterium]
MSQRRYFDEEMRYLHEAGKAFARVHPEQARYLNIDSVTDRDPYVERLFEGFALLTGRIREQLDDELPQYTEALCEMLFPHFLRPIPSLAMVSFRGQAGRLRESVRLPRGTEVQSTPVGEGVTCRFVTTRDVVVQPFQLDDVALAWAPDGTSSVTLTLGLSAGVALTDLDLRSLRLYFHAEPATAAAMHYFFTRRVREVTVESGLPSWMTGEFARGAETETEALTLRGQEWIRPGGLDPSEALLPQSERSFSGLRLVQEMLCFRPKFWCVDVLGIDRFQPKSTPGALRITVRFDKAFPQPQRFGNEQIRLFTSPVINLFESDGEPIRVDHRSAEYRVVPDARHRTGVEVYEVRSVTGIEDMTGRRHEYRSLLSPERTVGGRTYTADTGRGFTDRYESTITLQGIAPTPDGQLPVETLSLELRCTNGTVPREHLRERSLAKLAAQTVRGIEVENFTQPTLIRYPPTDRQTDFYWMMLSHWSLNYQSAATPQALAGVLSLYDWTDSEVNKRQIEGIRAVRWAPKERVHRGAVLRGSEVTVELDETRFADIGGAALLGLVLSRFFAAYATINSFVHLTIVMLPSGERMTWAPETGEQPVL